MPETSLAVTVSFVASSVVCLMVLSVQCADQDICLRRGTCVALDSSTCSFSNVVSASAWRIFNSSDTQGSLEALERGVCSPGSRQSVVAGDLVCLRHRSFPDATEREIMSPASTTHHEKACGGWIDTQSSARSTYWSFYDEGDVAEDVADALFAKYRVRSAAGAPSKFRSACVRMVTSAASGPAGAEAFAFLKARLPAATDRAGVLRAVGVLASHYCDAPAQVGLGLGDGGVVPNVTDGVGLSAPEAAEHLYAAGEGRVVQEAASAFASAMLLSEAAVVSYADARLVYEGATGGAAGEVSRGRLPALGRFVRALDSEGIQAANAYVLGCAARCSYAVREAIYGSSTTPSAARWTSGLGRLAAPDRLVRADGATLARASAMTLSGLRARRVLSSTSRAHAVSSCNSAMLEFFPDHVDRTVFELLVSPALYSRLGDAVAPIKGAVAAALRGDVISPTLVDPEAAALAVERSVIRVAGAVEGSWGGRFQALPSYAFESADGALVMLLRAAKSLFDQRTEAAAGASVCDLPPVFSSLSRNAYFWPDYGCTVILPGIVVPPFADAAFDDDSLRARLGWIFAHEFAHVTAAAAWKRREMDALLAGYAPSTHTEAIADLVATVAVHSLGVGRDELCVHLSQLWCGRARSDSLGLLHDVPTGSHPRMNERGDLLCAFLERHF